MFVSKVRFFVIIVLIVVSMVCYDIWYFVLFNLLFFLYCIDNDVKVVFFEVLRKRCLWILVKMVC